MPRETRSNSDRKPKGTETLPLPKSNMAEGKSNLTLQDVMNSITNLEKKLNKKIDEQSSDIKKNQDEKSEKIQSQLKTIEDGLSTNSDTVTTLQKNIDAQQATIHKLENKVEQLENDKRSHNLIIEGLREEDNEDLRATIDELLADIEMNFNVEWCDSIFRMGVKRQGPSRRPVKIILPFLIYRGAILRNAYKLKGMRKWNGVFIQEDLTPEAQQKKKETRAIFAYGKSKGLDIKMKGSHLVIDGMKYTSNENLPHELSIEAAKVIKVKDGLAFQGPHAPYSNLHKVHFVHKGTPYNSSEQALHHTRAVVGKQQHMADRIMEETDTYRILRLGKLVQDTEETKQECKKYLADILVDKFGQNPALKAKLMANDGHFYEATTNPTYGCGFTLSQCDQIYKENITAGNQLGLELERTRDYFRGQEAQDGGAN